MSIEEITEKIHEKQALLMLEVTQKIFKVAEDKQYTDILAIRDGHKKASLEAIDDCLKELEGVDEVAAMVVKMVLKEQLSNAEVEGSFAVEALGDMKSILDRGA